MQSDASAQTRKGEYKNEGKYTHRRLQAQAYPGIARVISNHAYTHITRTRREDAWSVPSRRHMSVRAYARTDVRIAYSGCSDKIRLPQLRIKCDIAKS